MKTNSTEMPALMSELEIQSKQEECRVVTRYLPRLSSRTALAAVIGVFVASIVSKPADASPILIPHLTSPATVSSCTLHPGSGDEVENGTGMACTSTSFKPLLADWHSTFIVGNFDGTPPTTQTFQTTFDDWNVAQGANYNGMWAIINGGNLDVTFDVTDTAFADPTFGGINPFTINVTRNDGYTGPDIGQLVWTQALYTSYGTRPPYPTDLNPPSNTLDTYSNSKGNTSSTAWTNPCQPIPGQTPGKNNSIPATIGPSQRNPIVLGYCDPIYPFQYAGASFFDGPSAYWPDESFRAIALLSTVTFVTDPNGAITERDLTVYNGVNWGFDLSVVQTPEPGTILLMIPSLAFLAALRHKAASGRRTDKRFQC
jgi:hypothetical protein